MKQMTRFKLPATVIAIGLVSFFNDLASEMVTPLIPILIATVLGAGPVILGLVEGVADAAASLLKLWAGYYSDAKYRRRKRLMVFGYGLSNLVRPLLGLVSSWGALLLLRSLDRAGKGLRNAPRDALLADSAPAQIHGLAYGFHRAMDNAGALGGTLLAVAALSLMHWPVREVILWSAVPGVLVLLVLAIGVREPAARELPAMAKPAGQKAEQGGMHPRISWSLLSPTIAPLFAGAGAVHLCARIGNIYPAAGQRAGHECGACIAALGAAQCLQIRGVTAGRPSGGCVRQAAHHADQLVGLCAEFRAARHGWTQQ